MNRAQRLEFFRRLQEANPEPTTELRYDSPFQLLVAVILSAQTTDRAVNKATEALFRDAPTAAAMAELGEEGIADYIRSIGLYHSKARHLAATCAVLRDQYGGAVPRERAALEALPGVGRKTANVVLNTIFGEPTIAVDTHLFRVANRCGLAPGKTPRAVEDALLKAVPAEYRRHAHHWLILHGRYTCTARRPACARCPVADLCRWPDKSAARAGAAAAKQAPR
ncbi:MAG TPA: endonuclease III [Rhodocyclaceae bacterium]